MICIHYDRDLDGFCSGAIVKKKFPDCKLIGWDYGRALPDFEKFNGEDVVMNWMNYLMNLKNKKYEKINECICSRSLWINGK